MLVHLSRFQLQVQILQPWPPWRPNFTAGDVTYLWTHNGTGNLLLPNSLTPTYNPGPGDQGNNVTLTLTVTRMSGVCSGKQSVVTYRITYRPTFVRSNITASGPNPWLCINSIPTPLTATPQQVEPVPININGNLKLLVRQIGLMQLALEQTL